jgi:hypothetical protein
MQHALEIRQAKLGVLGMPVAVTHLAVKDRVE